jgi:hypothetical protein
MLALHPDIQEEVVEQIISVIGYDRDAVRNFVKSSLASDLKLQARNLRSSKN